MLKNRFLVAFAFAGLLGFAACGAEEEPEVLEEPVVEEPAPIVEPAPAPIVTDTAVLDTAAADTAGM